MAMTASGLAAVIISKLNITDTAGKAAMNELASAIVTYIQQNATVSVTATATAVTSGTSTSPVTGSGSIS